MGRHGRHDRHAHPALVSTLAAGAVAVFGATAGPAQAQLAVELDHVDVTDAAGNANGVIEPGEQAAVTPHVVSTEFTPLEDLTGALAVAAADSIATIDQGTSTWPTTTFGVPSASTTPFLASIDATHACGVPLRFTLTLSSSLAGAELPVQVPTGSESADALAAGSTDAPVAIPDAGGAVEQSIVLSGPGRVRALRVRTASLTHGYSGDLRITVVGPDGRAVVLADRRGGAAVNAYDGTVFSDAAATDVRSAVPPFVQVRPEQPLSEFDGVPIAGTWTLRVEDRSLGATGVLGSWAIAAPHAVCGTREEPPPPPPEPLKPGNGNGQGHGYGYGLGLNGPKPGNRK